MKHVVKEMTEISDSREIFEAKTPPFITIFITLLFVMIGIAVIWSWQSHIDIVVKAQGAVRPNEEAVQVTNKVLARVEAVHVQNGQWVEEGDVLYQLEHEDAASYHVLLKQQKEEKEQERDSLMEFKQAVLEGDIDYAAENAKELFLDSGFAKRHQFMIELVDLTTQSVQLQEQLDNDFMLLESIEIGRNLFGEGSEYYLLYEDYQLRKNQLSLQQETAEYQFKTLLRDGEDVSEARKVFKEAELAYLNYVNQFELEIRQSITTHQQKQNELKTSIASLYVQMNLAIESVQEELRKLENELLTVSLDLDEYIVKAPISGYVYFPNTVTKGDLLQTGTEVLRIIPGEPSEYMVELAVANHRISEISVGDQVKFNVLSLPSRDYGFLYGTIESISPDATVGPDGLSYYEVKAAVSGNRLSDREGRTEEIKSGMMVEAHVISGEQSILKYVLDKLDFL